MTGTLADRTDREHARLCFAGLTVVLIVTVLLYATGLPGEFVFDDHLNLGPLNGLSEGVPAGEVIYGNRAGKLGRPVAMSSFVLDYWRAGYSPGAMKATNIALHLVNGLLLYMLVQALLISTTRSSNARSIALVVTAIWLLAPIHVSTVLYVVQRMAMLATTFLFAGLVLYVYGRRAVAVGREARGYAFIGLALVVCWPLAVFSKENGIILSALMALTEVFFFWSTATPATRRRVVALFVAVLVVPLVAGVALVTLNADQYLNYRYRDFTLEQRLLTQPRALSSYFLSGLLPGESRLGFFHDDFVASTAWFRPPATAAAVGLWAGAVAFVGWASFRRRHAVSAFGLGFFVIGHAVEGSFLPLELYFEHRNYLPLVGAVLFIVSLMMMLFERAPRRLAYAAVLVYLGVMSHATYVRVQIWQTEEKVTFASALTHPGSLRANTGLAHISMERGDLPGAIAALERALQHNPNHSPGIVAQLAYIMCRYDGAAETPLAELLGEQANMNSARYIATALGEWHQVAMSSGCKKVDVDRLVHAYAALIESDTNFARRRDSWAVAIRYYVGDFLLRSGYPNEAVGVLRPAAAGERVFVYMTLGEAYVGKGDFDGVRGIVNRLERMAADEKFPPEYAQRLQVLRESVAEQTY